MVNFKFRGAQLDLARQMETIPFIKEFIDSLAANHYNYLLLYLEDRIRTNSYPYPTDHECYTPEQMRELVAYAKSRNMEVIPCVSIYGHVERFLRHPQMQDLAELHDGRNGRFWHNSKQEFCPKNEKVYQFLQSYLNEIVPLFPCQYFHIGMDEVHNIGYCERCREQGQNPEGEAALFNTILMRGYDMLKQHGRRIMMWDDMFDHYENLLLTLPRDIIMVGWQYQDDIRFPRSHFGEIKVQDSQKKYSQLGFEYIIAPADWSLSNTRTFNDYVQDRQILGGLMTSWEKSDTFLYQSLPVFAYAGQLWSGKTDTEAWEAAINHCFAFSDKKFCQLLRSIYENKTVRQDRSLSQTSLLRCSFFGNNYGQNEIKKLLSCELQQQETQIKSELGKKIFADLNFSVHTAALSNQAKVLFTQAIDHGWNPERQNELEQLIRKFQKAAEHRRKQWEQFRPGITPCHVDNYFGKLPEILDTTATALQREQQGVLQLRFCLPCQYGAAKCRLSLDYGSGYQCVAEGIFKGDSTDNMAIFEQSFLCPFGQPESLRLEVWGYGGLGVCHAQYSAGKQLWMPESITKTQGQLWNPEHVLVNDLSYAFLAYPNTEKTFQKRYLADEITTVEIKLKLK
ncbi:MAG: family 20 glycosylhydrolase [Lentisphaeria bacterium]